MHIKLGLMMHAWRPVCIFNQTSEYLPTNDTLFNKLLRVITTMYDTYTYIHIHTFTLKYVLCMHAYHYKP